MKKILALIFTTIGLWNLEAEVSYSFGLKFTNNLSVDAFDITIDWENRREFSVPAPVLRYVFPEALNPGGMITFNVPNRRVFGDNLVGGRGFWTDRNGQMINAPNNVVVFNAQTPLVNECEVSIPNNLCFDIRGQQIPESNFSVGLLSLGILGGGLALKRKRKMIKDFI